MIKKNTITRRGALKAAGTGLLSLGLAGLPSSLLNGAGNKPNIIFILSDDHRWDAMSCMGHSLVETPALDRLAREGILFENAFVTTSLCSPSRASFLTGQYAHNHGVRNNLLPWNNRNVTFFELLKQAGYQTGFVGKWHMPGKFPRLSGLDRFVTFTESGGQGIYFNCPMVVDGRKVPSRHEYINDELNDYAVDFITKNRNGPFCLYLSHKAVHFPFAPPKNMKDLYRGKNLRLPNEADSWVTLTNGNFYPGTLQKFYRDYLAAVTALDRSIGHLLNELEKLNLADDTVVVYAGDNGHFFGEHHLFDKRWAYEEAIRIPFIVRYPGIISEPGARADQMVLNIDLAPTLLDIAGVRAPSDMDGRSFLPALKNRKTEGRKAWLYEYFRDYSYSIPDTHAVRTRRYKYIEYGNRRMPELYDLERDPGEKKNIISTRQGRMELPRLRNMLRALKAGVRM